MATLRSAAILILAASAGFSAHAADESDLVPGSPPDLYFVSPRGEVSLARLAYSEQSLKLCVRAAVSEKPTARYARILLVPGEFQRLHYQTQRISASSDGLWTVAVEPTMTSGFRPVGGLIRYFALRELIPTNRECLRETLPAAPDSQARAAINNWSEPIFKALAESKREQRRLGSFRGYAGWRCASFDDLTQRLIGAESRPQNAPCVPMLTIAAISNDEALVAIYLDSNIAFFRLVREVKFSARRRESDPRDPLDQPPASGAIEWTCVGVAQTAITRLASAFWFDESVHLLSDDGRYERFRIENGGATRTRDLAGLPAPLAICQGKSELWILSEADGEVLATRVDWREQTGVIRLDRRMGHDDFDKAAATLLDDSP